MKKITISIFLFFLFTFSFTRSAFAHVMVNPSITDVATFQTFDVGVPSEKDISTVELKLLIPSGLQEVTPNVKPGWTVNVVKNGDTVTEIDWTDGEIPSGQRDDFYFNAQVPAQITTIIWKAYQTYSDGSVVSWDANPTTMKSGKEGTPYSITQVINDLKPTPAPNQRDSQKTNISLGLSIIGIIIACVALSIARKKSFPILQTKRRKRSKSSLKK